MSEWLKGFKERGSREARSLIRDDFAGVDEWKSNWRRAALGGGRMFGSGAKSLGALGLRSLNTLASLSLGAFGRERSAPLPTRSDDSAERFLVAQDYYGQTEEDLIARQQGTHTWFLFYMAAAMVLFAIGIASWNSYATGLPVFIDCLGRFAAVPAMLALASRAAFHNWQLRTRALGSFSAWLRTPADWWTDPPAGGGGCLRPAIPAAALLIVGGAIAAAITMTPGEALAQAPAAAAGGAGNAVAAMFGTPGPNDLWYKLLTFVFPQVGSLGGTPVPVSQGIAGGFAAMIAILMALSGALMSYQIVVGTASTAHEGKLLGSRWHSMFAPIRVCYGVACLAPAINGYCLLQVLVVYGAVASGQIGNEIWKGFIDNLTVANVSEPRLEDTIQTVRNIYQMEVCYATAERLAENQPRSRLPAYPTTPTVTGTTASRTGGSTWWWIKRFWDSSSVRGEVSPDNTVSNVWNYGPCGNITASYARGGDQGVVELDSARLTALEELRRSLRTVARNHARASIPGPDSAWPEGAEFMTQVVSAKDAYDRALIAAAGIYAEKTSTVGFSEFQEGAKSAGWIAAGPYYMSLGRVNAQVLEYINTQPEVRSRIERLEQNNPLSDELWRQGGNARPPGILLRLQNEWDIALATTPTLSVAGARAGTFDNSGSLSGFLQHGLSPDSLGMSSLLKLAEITPGRGTAMVEMVNFGHVILGAASVILVIVAGFAISPAGRAASGIGSLIGRLGAGGSLSSFGTFFIGMIAIGLLTVGVFHAYILPMLPFIHFFFAVMGILCIVIEGVIAAPIWAFMHIRMDGQEFLDGPQKTGYMLVFNLLFRIPLTLFGLFFSILVFEAMVWLLSVTFMPAMVAATAGSMFGLFGLLTYFIMLTVINYQMATRSFHLITQVPDRVARWFGAQPDGGDEHNSIRAVGALIQQSTSQGLNAGSGAIKGAVGVSRMQGQKDIAQQQAATQERIAKVLEGGAGGAAGGGGGGGGTGSGTSNKGRD